MDADETGAMLRGERVWLRPLDVDDLAAYHQAVNDVEIAAPAGYDTPQSREDVAGWYENRVRMQHGRDGYFFAICPLDSRAFIGTAWLWNLGSRFGGAELSIFIGDKARWGMGLGTDAVNAAVDYGFGFLNLNRIWLTTSADNERARRSFAKAGFVVEGHLRAHHRWRGKLTDSLLMSLVRSDWESLARPRSWDYAAESSGAP